MNLRVSPVGFVETDNHRSSMLNLSGIINFGRLFFTPSLCMPQLVIKEFLNLPVPIKIPGHEDSKIKGIVVDKDNCLASDQLNTIWSQYQVCFLCLQIQLSTLMA